MPAYFGQFELLSNIGSGSMAELFKARNAHDPSSPTMVLKRVRAEFRYDTNLMARFVEGAQSVVGLRHPNIATVLDAGVQSGRYYAALEYIHGRDIRHIQERFQTTRRALPIPLALHLMTEICRGLEFAHDAKSDEGEWLKVVHCDVSSQNIMVSFDGDVKLINLEGAWFRKNGWAPTKGKFSYMSPEQASRGELERRSDIFSAGIVFWEILTGRRLFAGESDAEICAAVERAEISPPTQVNKLVPKELETIIIKALAKEPDGRFQTATELREALEAFAEKSRMTFSSKQLAGWMKMTFEADLKAEKETEARWDKRAAAQDLAKAAEARSKNKPKPTAPLADDEIEADMAYVEDEEDSTRIDPTSQMLAGLDQDAASGSDGGPPSSVVLASFDDAVFRPDASLGTADFHADEKTPSVNVSPPDVDDDESHFDEASRPSIAGLEDPTLPANAYLDDKIAERRDVEADLNEIEAPEAARDAVRVIKHMDEEKELPKPRIREKARVAGDAGRAEELEAEDLDHVLKDRRHLDKRMGVPTANTYIRFERPQGQQVEVDERSSMLHILIIVGAVLALGLGVLTYMMLQAEDAAIDDEQVQQHQPVQPAQIRAALIAPPPRRG